MPPLRLSRATDFLRIHPHYLPKRRVQALWTDTKYFIITIIIINIIMVTAFLRRLLALTVPLLFASTTTLVQFAEGASSDSNSYTTECATEIIACQEDDTCFNGCFAADEDGTVETHACIDALGVVSNGSFASASCDDVMTAGCCLDEVSDGECLENEAFVDYWLCFAGTMDCLADEITCDDDETTYSTGLGIISTAPVVGVSSAFAMLLLLLPPFVFTF